MSVILWFRWRENGLLISGNRFQLTVTMALPDVDPLFYLFRLKLIFSDYSRKGVS